MCDEIPLDELRALVARQRIYASLREGGSKGQKELAVLRDLFSSLEASGHRRYSEPHLAAEDPPDCTLRTSSGGVAAVEITEFVSQKAVELNERARRVLGRHPEMSEMVMARWDATSFLAHLEAVLTKKDRRTFKGGPYQEVIVIAYEDEPLLVREQVERWLDTRSFGPFKQLTHAFFLFSYEPASGGYPYRRLFGAA
jgi:hypothetical protein